MFGSDCKLKVKKDLWEKVRKACGREDHDRNIAREVLETYLRSKQLIRENEELKRIGDKNSNTIQALRKSFDELYVKHDEMEKEVASTKAVYENLKRDHETLRRNPIIKERIVYKEDKKAVEELRQRRDQLQKELWKVRVEKDQILQKKRQMEDKAEKLERTLSDWKRRNFAVLVIGELSVSQDELNRMRLEILDSTSYYEWRGEKDKFERLRDILSPYVVKVIER